MLTIANKCNGDGAVKKQKQEAQDLAPLELPTRSGAGEVYASEIWTRHGFSVGISTYSRQAYVERMSMLRQNQSDWILSPLTQLFEA
jgi:hypothetical protein